MKVYLINAPSDFLLDNKSNLPLGILFVHAYLKKNGIDVSVVDLAGMTSDSWKIPEDGDVYGISATTPQFEAACKIAKIVKKPNNLVVLGGVHGTCRPYETLKTGLFDIVVRHEGEETMLEIVSGKCIHDIDGISFVKEEKIIHNKNRAFQKNIDIFPHPDFSAIDIDSYHSNVFLSVDDPLAKGTQIITSRGCPYNCAFCCSPYIYQRKVRFHSIEYMEKWLDYLQARKYNNLFLVDDTILVNNSWLNAVCDLFKSKGFKWRASIRGDQCTLKKMQKMYDSGCCQVDIGVESGSQKVLNFVGKNEKIEHNGNAIRFAHEAGLKVKTSFIVGLPGEQQEDVNLTKEFIKTYKPDIVVLCTFIPFPGCAIGNNPERYGFYVDPSAPYSTYILQGACPNSKPASSDLKNKMTLDFRDQLLDTIREVSTTDSDIYRKKGKLK